MIISALMHYQIKKKPAMEKTWKHEPIGMWLMNVENENIAY